MNEMNNHLQSMIAPVKGLANHKVLLLLQATDPENHVVHPVGQVNYLRGESASRIRSIFPINSIAASDYAWTKHSTAVRNNCRRISIPRSYASPALLRHLQPHDAPVEFVPLPNEQFVLLHTIDSVEIAAGEISRCSIKSEGFALSISRISSNVLSCTFVRSGSTLICHIGFIIVLHR